MRNLRALLRRVDDGRFGRAIAGMVTHQLVVREVVRRERETVAEVLRIGVRGKRVYGVAIGARHATCSCSDYRERGVLCKHIAALVLHELGEAAAARSQRRKLGVLVQR